MNQKIITIAEIVFALIFVVLLAVFMATINSKGNAANNQLVDVMDANSTSSIESYEGQGLMKGTRVTGALESIASIAGDVNDFRIGVFTNDNKGVGDIYTRDVKYNINNSKESSYINPNGDFYCHIVYNKNNIAVGMCFVQDDVANASDPDKWTMTNLGFSS